MATITYKNASCIYPGSDKLAVDSLNLDIADGEFVVLVGPSGSGKSTALRMLAGLEDIDEGNIEIGGKDMVGVPSKDRDIAMVFQNYALYPTKTVAENMGFALKLRGVSADERRKKVEEAAKLLDLSEFLDRKPAKLSGGQRQRVAMGRAIVRDAAGVLHGRAAVQPGRQAARADPHPDRRAAAPAGHHHRLRHPRPGRGHDDGRSRRRAPGGKLQQFASPMSFTTSRPTRSWPASSAHRR